MFLLRKPILAISDSAVVRGAVSKAPITRSVVDRFIPGETTADAVAAVVALRAKGLQVTLDHLGEDTTDRATADATVAAYLELIDALSAAGQVSGRGGVGQAVGGRSGTDRVPRMPGRWQCLRAGRRRTDRRRGLRRGRPDEPGHGGPHHDRPDPRGAVRTAPHPPGRRRRDPGDAAAHARRTWPNSSAPGPGCGWSRAPTTSRPTSRSPIPDQIDLAYVRAMKYLMYGKGYPMIGSHDPRMVAIAAKLASDCRPDPRPLGAPDALRDPARRAGTAGQGRARRCGSTCRTGQIGTATSPAGWPSARPICCSSCVRWPAKADPGS